MSQMKPVTITFNDKSYTVDKEESIWGLIESIEDVITFLELAPAFQKQKFPSAKIFRAYAAALNYAGAKVTPNEVREASTYSDMGEMAGSIAAILIMAQPGADIDLGESQASDAQVEEVKKKATDA